MCGGEVVDSAFLDNEATGLFGALVNGDLSDEDRLDAALAVSSSSAGNFTCPPLYVTGTVFDGNVAVGGYGGGIASVDAGLSVINSTFFSTVGGALYFGTSDGSGRDQLEVGWWLGGEVGRWTGQWMNGYLFPLPTPTPTANAYRKYKTLSPTLAPATPKPQSQL